jgi:hypothetical protein
MIRQVLRFLGSISIALLITASGLIFNASELTYAGGLLLALVSSLWLLLRFNPLPDRKELETIRERRRDLIRESRTAVSNFSRRPDKRDFRNWFESTPLFSSLRRHFRREFLSKWNNRRLVIAAGDGPIDPFAKLLLDEIDYLEGKWGLENS